MSVFLPQTFLGTIADGAVPSADDIETFIDGIGTGATNDAQIAAFTMALYHHDFAMPERIALTKAMIKSGDVLNWNVPGPVLDKHSTGGVGDNVSIILGPLVAACGAYIPMISGRGLGHTGGTLDKFDAIPGYNTHPDTALFKRVVEQIGCAIIGQTGDLAPADARIYAIRSATATVKNISLITASILANKKAAGLDALVLDVKCGDGAVMRTQDEARALARSLVEVGNGLDMRTSALITDMNEPLASAAGNAVEMRSAIDFLTGAHRDARLQECVLQLGTAMLRAGDLATNDESARISLNTALTTGRALEVFSQMVSALGGPSDLADRPDKYLEAAPIIEDIVATDSGTITAIDTYAIGMAVIVLGGGRKRANDPIDYAVGFDRIRMVGSPIQKGQALLRMHARDQDSMQQARAMIEAAYQIGAKAKPLPVVLDTIG